MQYRKIAAMVCVGVIALMIMIVSIYVSSVSVSYAKKPSSSQQQLEYVLKEYYGRIAVFRTGETNPSAVYDVYTSTLPDMDRDALAQGIMVVSREELDRLIEDFTS